MHEIIYHNLTLLNDIPVCSTFPSETAELEVLFGDVILLVLNTARFQQHLNDYIPTRSQVPLRIKTESLTNLDIFWPNQFTLNTLTLKTAKISAIKLYMYRNKSTLAKGV